MSRTSIPSLLLALGVVASACSGGTADTAVASLDTDVESATAQEAETGLIPGEEAVLAFTACLRDEGLDIDDPAVDGDGNLVAPSPHAVAAKSLDMAAVHSAFDVC
jgi:hypothetical protein